MSFVFCILKFLPNTVDPCVQCTFAHIRWMCQPKIAICSPRFPINRSLGWLIRAFRKPNKPACNKINCRFNLIDLFMNLKIAHLLSHNPKSNLIQKSLTANWDSVVDLIYQRYDDQCYRVISLHADYSCAAFQDNHATMWFELNVENLYIRLDEPHLLRTNLRQRKECENVIRYARCPVHSY